MVWQTLTGDVLPKNMEKEVQAGLEAVLKEFWAVPVRFPL